MSPLLLGLLASCLPKTLALASLPHNASERSDLLPDDANFSSPDNATFSVPVFDNLGLAKVSVFFLMFAFCIIANVYMLNLIRRMRRHRSVMNQLLVHLCVADLLVATFNMFGEALWIITVQWRAGVVECKLFKFAQPFSVTLSTCLVVLIGVDRASVILCPIQRPLHERLVKHYIGGVYILSVIVNLPQFWVFTAHPAPFKHVVFIQCVHLHMLPGRITQLQISLLFWFNWIMNYLLPIVLIITSYILILIKLHAASKDSFGTVYEGLPINNNNNNTYRCQFKSTPMSSGASGCMPSNRLTGNVDPDSAGSGNSGNGGGVVLHTTVVDETGRQRMTTYVCHNRNNLFRRAKVKSIQISSLIVAIFLLCWTPYYVTYLLKTVLDSKALDEQLPKIFCFGQMSSLFNPLIYGIFHCNFGKRSKSLTHRVKWQKRLNNQEALMVLAYRTPGNEGGRPTERDRGCHVNAAVVDSPFLRCKGFRMRA